MPGDAKVKFTGVGLFHVWRNYSGDLEFDARGDLIDLTMLPLVFCAGCLEAQVLLLWEESLTHAMHSTLSDRA